MSYFAGCQEAGGLSVGLEDPPGAEADHLPARVADGPEQPALEEVVALLTGQPGGDQLLVGETPAA